MAIQDDAQPLSEVEQIKLKSHYLRGTIRESLADEITGTLYPDDQSVNPRVTVYLSHPDSIETGRRRYIKTIVYIKDGQPHTYILTMPVPEKTILHLRGWLYNFDNLPYGLEKHAKIENISFTYRSVAV